jgi:hypothetical protein
MREGQAERNMVEMENRYIDRCADGSIGQDEGPEPDDAGPEAPPACVWPDVWVAYGGCHSCHDCEVNG